MTVPACRFGVYVDGLVRCHEHNSLYGNICDIGLAALRAKLDTLQAERGVLVNSARLVACAALPFLKREDKEKPSHNTGEVLREALQASQRLAQETNRVLVVWMQTMKDKLNEQARVMDRQKSVIYGLAVILKKTRKRDSLSRPCWCRVIPRLGHIHEHQCHDAQEILEAAQKALSPAPTEG